MLDKLLGENPNRIAIIRYHGTGSSDPFWIADSLEIRQRRNYYGVIGVPMFFFNGTYSTIYLPGEEEPFSQVQINHPVDPAYFESYQYSPVQILLDAQYDSITRQGKITASILSEGDLSGMDLKLHCALTESDLYYEYYSRKLWNHQVLRKMIPDHLGAPISLQRMEDNAVVSLDFTLDTSWVEENCEIVAFVQDDKSKKILQGGKIHFPVNKPFLVIKDFYLNPDGFLDPGENTNLIL